MEKVYKNFGIQQKISHENFYWGFLTRHLFAFVLFDFILRRVDGCTPVLMLSPFIVVIIVVWYCRFATFT